MIKVDRETASEVGKFAEKVRRLMSIEDTLNVDMDKVIEKLGGKVIPTNDIKLKGVASVEKTGDNSFIIKVAKGIVPESEKKFCKSHEIGHLLLHMGYIIDEEKWKSISNGETYKMGYGAHTYIEEIADIFGLAFLMPRSKFLEVSRNHINEKGYNIDDIAMSYDLPQNRVIQRGIYLGIWRE